MVNMKYLLNRRSFISLMVLFSFFDNFGMDTCGMEGENVERVKIIFVGDAGVGKTTIISRIIDNPFNDAYEPSIGIDFMLKNITFRGTTIKLQMWDTDGQEKYKRLIPAYVRNSSIVFLIYDVSVKSSFDNIPNWISLIRRSIEKNATLVLCGNKIDLENRKVTKEEGEALAQKEGLPFFEVSAKTEDGIKNMFYNSVADLPTFAEHNSNKEKLVEELLQKDKNEKLNENKNEELFTFDDDYDYNYTLNTERSSLCSSCINCLKICFKCDNEKGYEEI